jgi:hypothetical protein
MSKAYGLLPSGIRIRAARLLILLSAVAVSSCDPLLEPDAGGEVAVRPDGGAAAIESEPTPVLSTSPDELTVQQFVDPGTGMVPGDATGRREFRVVNLGTATLHWSAVSSQPWLDPDPASGAVDPSRSATVLATVNANGLEVGEHDGEIVVSDPAAAGSPQVLSVRLEVSPLSTLELGGPPVTGLSGEGGHATAFHMTVPEGVPAVEVTTSGGEGLVTLYVRYGRVPDPRWFEFDCRSLELGVDHRCLLQGPAAGDWYVLLDNWSGYSGVTLQAVEADIEPVIDLHPNYLVFRQLRDIGNGETVDVWPSTQPLPLSNPGLAPLHYTTSVDQPWLTVDPATGVVPPLAEADIDVTVDSGELVPGYYRGEIEVADPAAYESPQTVFVELSLRPLETIPLGVPVEDVTNVGMGTRHFRVWVPEGVSDLEIRTSGGSGVLELNVQHGAPLSSAYDCRTEEAGTEDSCTFPDPEAGYWYIDLWSGEDNFEGVTLVATVEWTLGALIGEVERLRAEGSLPQGIARSLRARLEAALAAGERGRTNAARSMIGGLIHQLGALSGAGKVDPVTAAYLIAAVRSLVEA